MGWAQNYISMLLAGNTITFRPRGNSMVGRIRSGQLCTVEPVTDPQQVKVNDIVLCRVAGNDYLHIVKAVANGRFQIGNNRGHINGWIGPNALYGLCIKVED